MDIILMDIKNIMKIDNTNIIMDVLFFKQDRYIAIEDGTIAYFSKIEVGI